MFSFLNRNKSLSSSGSVETRNTGENGHETISLQGHLEDVQKNLYIAITSRRTDIVVSILNEWFKDNKDEKIKYFFNTNYCENRTTNPLIVAYELKDRDLMRALLNFGADPSLTDIKNKKCLTQLVIENETDESMKQLLSDSFMQAIVMNNLNIIRQFLESGFQKNLNKKCLPDENTYLHWAVMYSNESMVRLMLEHGAEVNAVNKFGATPLHECIAKKKVVNEETLVETLEIIETLLSFKADPFNIKGTDKVFKDLTPMDMASNLYHLKQEPEIFNLIKDFNSDGLSTTSSSPNSPLTKANSLPINPITTINESDSTIKEPVKPATSYTPLTRTASNNIIHALDSISMNTSIDSESNTTSLPKTPPKFAQIERQISWNSSSDQSQADKDFKTEKERVNRLLWPQPQTLIVFNEDLDDRFMLDEIKTKPLNVYIKPPFTYAYMDFINRIANAFGGMDFMCIHKPPANNSAYISVTIDKTLFQRENAYSLLVTKSKIEIIAIDEVALQYALFTFMQLCKIYARTNIPSLRILDHSDIKYRAILFDFSQGFYFKYEYFLAILQMLTFYKINQVHFYVKFSSLPPESTKSQWYHTIKNWFGLMKFCEEVNLQVVPTIDICNDVAELTDVIVQIKEYLELFQKFKFLNVGPRLTSLLTCMDNKNPFSLDSDQYMMLCSYLYHAGDKEMLDELEKIENCVFMEYGLKSGTDFELKSKNLYKSGRPYFHCVGSNNWNSLLGSPEGCLYNVFDSIKRQKLDNPNGMVLCNFSGSMYKTAFAFNLNSMVILAGCAWKSSVELEEVKTSIPKVISTHGLISQSDGEIGVLMLELGNLETYLTRKEFNSEDFLGLPNENGSLFIQMLHSIDSIELDNFDKNIFKNVLFQLRAHQSKLKSLLTTSRNHLFKEVYVAVEIAINLFKFLYILFNAGTRQQRKSIGSTAGLSVVNIGVANINLTTRTDLANKLILLMEEYTDILPLIYSEDSTRDFIGSYFNELIDKLLQGQLEQNLSEYSNLLKYRQRNLNEKPTPSSLNESKYLVEII